MSSTELTQDQLACLSSPARGDVFVCLRTIGRAPARELAVRMRRAPATIHYHLKELAKVGLVRVAEHRPTSRKPEAVYEPTADRLILPKAESGSPNRELVQKTVLAGLRQVMRGYKAATESAQKGKGRIHVLRAQLKLKEEDLATFLNLIEQADQFASSHRSEDGALVHWSSLVYPDVNAFERGRGQEV